MSFPLHEAHHSSTLWNCPPWRISLFHNYQNILHELALIPNVTDPISKLQYKSNKRKEIGNKRDNKLIRGGLNLHLGLLRNPNLPISLKSSRFKFSRSLLNFHNLTKATHYQRWIPSQVIKFNLTSTMLFLIKGDLIIKYNSLLGYE